MNMANALRFLKTSLVVTISLLLFSSEGAAFTVNRLHGVPLGFDPIHMEITRDAFLGLPPVYLSNGQSLTFSDQAITDIADSNTNADTIYSGNPERHFDMELFATGQTVLRAIRMAIVVDLKGPTSGLSARELLGGALHTLHDFYAHSTWVENGFGSTAPLGEPVPIPYVNPASSADLCGDHNIVAVVPMQLTSGFYDSVNLLTGSNAYSWLVGAIKKCGHGAGFTCNDINQCPSEDIHANWSGGINKDSSVRQHHVAARIAATASTREYVQLILADLGNDDSADVAKCKLMGRDCPMLFLRKDGTGTGELVISDPPTNEVMQSCGGNCTQGLRSGTLITLEAKPDAGFEFLGWGEDCGAHGTTNPIQLTLSSTLICKATFGALPAVRFNPYGSKNLSDGPFYLELVDATLAGTTTTEDVTVTFLRQVFSNCRGLLFSSNRVVAVPKGQSYSSELSGYVAGRDPFCNTLPIRTELTITSAILGASKPLNVTSIPAAQRKVAITR